MRAWLMIAAVLAGCQGEHGRHRPDAEAPDGASFDASPIDGLDARDVDGPADAPDPSLDDAPSVAVRACGYRSLDFTGAPLELDTGPGSSERLRFTVAGVPDPALVVSATLRFSIFDADHPGEEGSIRLNGGALVEIPAMTAWDNIESVVTLDVTGATVLGDNEIVFGPGPLARTFFRVSMLSLELSVRVSECAPVDPPPDPLAVRRSLHFHEATFTNRATWVVPCPPGHPRFAAIRDYAFTASGADQVGTDCEDRYVPGGSRRGTATFSFEDVIPSTYGIYVRYRSSANRNPRGALFTVNDEPMRIDQVDGSGEYFEVLFGDRRLEGTVRVVLDSSVEAESDSVTSIRLEPR
jgi:hypothetical protein